MRQKGSQLPCTPLQPQHALRRSFCLHRHEKIDFWDDVYGFNMKCIKGLAMQEPLVDVVDQEQVATKPCLMATFNLSSMTKEDASFTVRANALLQSSCKASLAAVHLPGAGEW